MRDRPLTLPPEIEHPLIEQAAAEYLKLTGNLADAQVKLAELEENRRRSVAADREAHATAIRAGKPDPGEPKTKLADAEILVLNRRREALEVAVGQARRELITTVGEHRAAWQKTIAKRRAQRQEQAATALEQLTAALDALASAVGLEDWLETFTATPERALWHPSRFASRVPGVTSPNGDPYGVSEILAALRTLVDPPASKPAPLLHHPVAAPSDPAPTAPSKSLVKAA